MMRLLERYGQKLESTRTSHEMKIDELKKPYQWAVIPTTLPSIETTTTCGRI